MQINPTMNNAPGINISGQAGADMGLAHLAEGDSVTARVIFSGEGTAHLKTAEGALIRARLDGGITLPEGSQVTLTVEQKTADNITLRIADVSGTSSGAANNGALRAQALPPALAAVFEQIQASGLPTAAKVDLFVKALADFPALNAQSQAVQEALAALTSQSSSQPPAPVGLGQMLVELAVLVSRLETPNPGGQQANVTASPAGEAPAPGTASPTATAATAAAAIIAAADGAALPNSAAAITSGSANPAVTAAAAAMATAEAVLSAPAANPSGATAANPQAEAAPPASATATTAAPAAGSAQLAEGTATPTTAANAPATAANTPTGAAAAPNPASANPAAPAAGPANAPPPEALQTVRQMIGELYPPGQSEPSPKELAQFIERLFAHMGRTVEQGGTELQKCARELEVRLNLLKEAISQSSLPQREELLGQTNRILQQTEALREARLFCMQLPIQFEQQRQTAELYIYRRERRAGQKLDAQNATILLALNTEHLGRLEALIQTRGKEINLKLEIARAEAVPLVREYSQALPSLLKEAGFKLNSSSVEHLQRERNNPQAAERALIEYRRNFDGKLDFFI